MAAASAFAQPVIYVPDNRVGATSPGAPLVGAKIYFFVAGSSTPLAVYHDSDLNTSWTQPLVTNASGQTDDPVYMSPTPAFKVLITDDADVDLPGYPVDMLSPYEVAS